METIKVQKNQIIAKQKEKVKAWYLILEGSVVQRNSYARIVLNKESVIGVSEKDRFLCDYIAREDSVLAVFPYNTADDLINALNGQESMRGTLLRAALKQRQMLLEMYAGFKNLVRQLRLWKRNITTIPCSAARCVSMDRGLRGWTTLNRLIWYIWQKTGRLITVQALQKKDILMNT